MGPFVNTCLMAICVLIVYTALIVSAESRIQTNVDYVPAEHAAKVSRRSNVFPNDQALFSERAWHGGNGKKPNHVPKYRPSGPSIKKPSSKKPYTTRDADGTEHIHTFSEEHIHLNDDMEVIEPSLMESAMMNSYKRFKFRGFKPGIHNLHTSSSNYNNFVAKKPHNNGPPKYKPSLGKIRPSPPDLTSGIHNFDETKIPTILQKDPPRLSDLNIVLNGQTKFKDFESLLGHMGSIGYKQFEEHLKKKELEEKYKNDNFNFKEISHIGDFQGAKPQPYNDYIHKQPSFQHNVQNVPNFDINPAKYEYLNEHPISQESKKNLEKLKGGAFKEQYNHEDFRNDNPIPKPQQNSRPNFQENFPIKYEYHNEHPASQESRKNLDKLKSVASPKPYNHDAFPSFPEEAVKRPEPSSFQSIKHITFKNNSPFEGSRPHTADNPTTYKPEEDKHRPNYPSSFDLDSPEKYSAMLASKTRARQKPVTPSAFSLPNHGTRPSFRAPKPPQNHHYSSLSDGMLGQESTTVEQVRSTSNKRKPSPTNKPPVTRSKGKGDGSKGIASPSSGSSSRGRVKFGDSIREGDLS